MTGIDPDSYGPRVERYEIVVAGCGGELVESALEEFEMCPADPGRFRLVGGVVDQAALHGALHRLQDLQLEIIEVRRLDS